MTYNAPEVTEASNEEISSVEHTFPGRGMGKNG